MQLSNRLTFSLASLIFLIALGLILVPTSVMAHDDASDAVSTPRPHDHPLKTALPNDTGTDGTGTAVPIHDAHPTVMSIEAKPDASTATVKTNKGREVILLAADGSALTIDGTTDGVFNVRVTFTGTLSDNGDTTVDDAEGLDVDEVAIRARRPDGTSVTLGNPTFVVSAVTGEKNQFDVAITLPSSAFWGGTPAASLLPIEVFVDIASDAVENRAYTNSDGNPVSAVGSDAHRSDSTMKFDVVATLSEDPMAPGAPTNLTAMADQAAKTITLDWDAPSDTGTSAITGYTVTKTYDMADGTAATPKEIDAGTNTMITIPGADDDPLPGNVEFTFTVTATNAAGTSDPSNEATALIDTAPPMVTITAPAMANTDGTLTFMISFNEELGSGLSALQATDFEIEGGSAVAADLTGPVMDADGNYDYELEVTPDTVGGSVTVTLMPNMVADVAGNPLADVDAMGNTPSATVDTTPPTVVITAPTDPDDDGNLTFTFDFSEEVQPDTITLDRSGSDNVRLGENSDPMVDADDKTIYTILVEPRDPAVDTTVLLLKGSVMDLAGNGLAADAEATYRPAPPANEKPVFEGTIKNMVWCEGVDIGSITLPLARDSEGETLIYSLLDADGNVADEIPEDPADPIPTMGLYWVNVDSENRVLRGTTETTDGAPEKDGGTKYQWTVTDEQGESATLTFTISVNPYEKPMAVTDVMATKLNGEAIVGDDVDRVVLKWTNPNPGMYPNNPDGTGCVPLVTSYIITRQALNSHTQGRTAKGAPVSMTISVKDAAMDGGLGYTTAKLDRGTYEFTITAVNAAGNSPASDKAMWERTTREGNQVMLPLVIVDNPPMASQNLRANQTEQPAHSVTLDWIPPTHNPDAPVNDAADAMELYKVDGAVFGRYHLEVTNQATADVMRRPTRGFISGSERSYRLGNLQPGEYTVRVVAWNVVGEGALSNSQDFEIDVHDPGSEDTMPPVFDGDVSIGDLVLTSGVRVVELLPLATDNVTPQDDLDYDIDPALPAGLELKNNTIEGTPTEAKQKTAYTYSVEDAEGNPASLRFTITVNAAVAGPPPTHRPTGEIPAKGFVVFVRDSNNPPHFGTSNPLVAQWPGTETMPNLHDLFMNQGGSLRLNSDKDLVFSEIMWAVDEGKVGQDSYDGKQWVEVHNRTDAAVAISSISFTAKEGRPALDVGADRVSNVVGGGEKWIRTKGQNGNSGAADGSGQKEFISMYRTRYDREGWLGRDWGKSSQVYHPNHKGTPGTGEAPGPKTFTASGVALTTVFNEISNSSNPDHEWIELRIRSGDPHFENWVVDMVTSASDRAATDNPKQERLFQMPKLNTGRYDDILLITKTDPARDDDHPLRGGYNVEVEPKDQDGAGRDKNIKYYVADEWDTDLPDNGNFVLILRHGNDKTNHEKIQDIAGYHPDLKVDRADFFSGLWPLIGYSAPNLSNNKIEAGQVAKRVYDDIPGTRTKDGNKIDKVAFRHDNNGWTGIGYKRNADAGAKNGGTPGYPNNALQSNETQAGADPVIISEIMYGTGDRGNIPQWIELRNMSQMVGVNLDGWQITIVNHDQDSADATDAYPGDLVKSYNINGKIPPGQTFLITAHSGTDNTNLPSERIVALNNRRGELILSKYGFEITLESKEKDGSRKLADQVGNLAAGADARRRGNPQSYATPDWMLPAGTNADGDRVSIVRVSGRMGILDGLEAYGWKSFDVSAHLNAPESTYYGNRNDLSSPGYTIDGVLPVSLSKFRPERLATGEVVVRWATESETNNAGFNILRGEALDGEFTKLNEQLIAGKGTTSERTTYEFVDTSAKPNVVYYYQIQDVSLDGDVATLRTTHLRGNISVVGKLTTTWGELKALQ